MARCYKCMREFPDGFAICPHCGYEQAENTQDLYYLPPGTLLANGRYQIGTAVNTGGFGIVYRAWDTVFDKMIAVKEYYPGGKVTRIPGTCQVVVYSEKDKGEYARGKQDFLIEARTVARFSNLPNVVDVYDYFEANNTAHMVMEFMNGIPYSQYIRQHGGKLDLQTAMAVTHGVLEALKEVHKAKVIHCDIKPNNIFIDTAGTVKVKLFDFGAAYLAGVERKNDTLTPCYAPPELYNTKGKRGPYTDIYSVGAMMYFALTSIKPEEATDRLHEDHLIPLNKANPSVSVGVSNAVMRAMALKEDIRFQNAEQFAQALVKGNALDVEAEIRRRKRKRVLQVAATLTVLLGAGAACVFNMKRQRDENTLRPARLEVWVMADENDVAGEGSPDPITADQRFSNMTKNFQEEYGIDCQVTVIQQGQYADKINEAAQNGELPDVFDSTYLDAQYMDQLQSLDETWRLMGSPDGLLFLNAYDDKFPEKKQMPLCFQVPLVYVRQEAAPAPADGEEAETQPPESGFGSGLAEALHNVEELKDEDGAYSYSVKADDYLLYDDLLGDGCVENFYQLAKEKDRDMEDAFGMFRDGQVRYYLSDTADYQLMYEAMPGQFQVVPLGFDRYQARFDHLWSVNKSSGKAKKKAAQWLIFYMLSDRAQNALGVKSLEGVPLSETIRNNVFFEVYNGDLLQIQGHIPNVEPGGSDWIQKNLEYREKWENR